MNILRISWLCAQFMSGHWRERKQELSSQAEVGYEECRNRRPQLCLHCPYDAKQYCDKIVDWLCLVLQMLHCIYITKLIRLMNFNYIYAIP